MKNILSIDPSFVCAGSRQQWWQVNYRHAKSNSLSIHFYRGLTFTSIYGHKFIFEKREAVGVFIKFDVLGSTLIIAVGPSSITWFVSQLSFLDFLEALYFNFRVLKCSRLTWKSDLNITGFNTSLIQSITNLFKFYKSSFIPIQWLIYIIMGM